MTKRELLEANLFSMAYEWGAYGVETDEKCNAFQLALKQYRDEIKEEMMQNKKKMINQISK